MEASLDDYFSKYRKFKLSDGLFSILSRLSIYRSYELFSLASRDVGSVQAFHLFPALRASCEDLIVLLAIEKMTPPERDQLLSLWLNIEVGEGVESQARFFSTFKSLQAVIMPRDAARKDLKARKQEICKIWRSYGYNSVRRNAWKPTSREMAEKSGKLGLDVFYDYIFRLTSRAVHFSPNTVLKQVWGDDVEMTYSSESLDQYFRDSLNVYGLMILIFQHGSFGPLVGGEFDSGVTNRLEQCLARMNRWPEIVLHEELNRKRPGGGFNSVIESIVLNQMPENGFRAYLNLQAYGALGKQR